MLRSVCCWISYREVRMTYLTTSYVLFLFVNHALFHMVTCTKTRCLSGGVWTWTHSCSGWNGQCKHELLVQLHLATWRPGRCVSASVLAGLSLFCFQARYCHRRILRSEPGNSRSLSGVSTGHRHLNVAFFFPFAAQ